MKQLKQGTRVRIPSSGLKGSVVKHEHNGAHVLIDGDDSAGWYSGRHLIVLRKKVNKSKRKIIQIAIAGTGNGLNMNTEIVALCNDGTAWIRLDHGKKWTQLPPIPQPAQTEGDAP